MAAACSNIMNTITDTKRITKAEKAKKSADAEFVISTNTRQHSSSLREIWRYRELLQLLIRRDFISAYKQTVLGPLWFFIQPVMTSLVFTVVFGQIAKLSTDTLPPFIFYMSGIIVWSFFSNCVTKTSYTFLGNTSVFNKIYFPRIIAPISQIFTNLLNFLVQFGILTAFVLYFIFRGAPIHPNYKLIILPVVLVQIMVLGLGIGCIIAALTVRYRDLNMAVGFSLQLWMYASCIFYPRSIVPEKFQWLMTLNPMASIIECFRYTFLGIGQVEIYQWAISGGLTLLTGLIGFWMFVKSEGTFTDSI